MLLSALSFMSLLLAAPPLALGPTPPTIAVPRHPDGRAELILIGDTGDPGPLVETWKRTLRGERAKATLVLGDLLYPQAPPCPNGKLDRDGRAMIESHLRQPFLQTGKPTFLMLGNHDTSWVDTENPKRDFCVLEYFRKDPKVRLPARVYALDLGLAIVIVLDTNTLDDAQATFARATIAAHPGKRVLFAGHFVLKTYRDKDSEDLVRPWLVANDLHPELWMNGHAHILQFGVYDGIPALTSGTASRPRERAPCNRAEGTGTCGEHELFGTSTPGYATLEVVPAADRPKGSRIVLTFKDLDRKTLWTWEEP
jgi:predicted phosphodiesterase